MTATATVGAAETPWAVADAASPTVFVDGAPDSRLRVVQFDRTAPLDSRSAVVEAPLATPANLVASWQRAALTLTEPIRLAGDAVRWRVLMTGRLGLVDASRSIGRDTRRYAVADMWTARLRDRIAHAWAVSGDTIVPVSRNTVLLPGAGGNRSADRYGVNGRSVHVIDDEGEPWSVTNALGFISALGRLDLWAALIPPALSDAPLVTAVDLSLPIERVLRAMLEPYRLSVRRDMERRAGRLVERRWIVPTRSRRVVPATHRVLRSTATGTAPATRRWVARGAGWEVESTFELAGQWDTSLESAPDSAYDRVASDDFTVHQGVFRRWVLNEDNALDAPPFDLASLFESSEAIEPAPLRFRRCVTTDADGERLDPIVELSADDGATWSRAGGSVVVLNDRAGVYLNDDTLDPAFLSAARSGLARVRVTAALRSPLPVEAVRWRGNPFTALAEPLVFDVSGAFAFRRVAPTSVFHADVVSGARGSASIDQSSELARWLVERMRLPSPDTRSSSEMVTLAGAWTGIAPGDRMPDTWRADDRGNASAGRAVSSIRVRFGVTPTRGPQTRLTLAP